MTESRKDGRLGPRGTAPDLEEAPVRGPSERVGARRLRLVTLAAAVLWLVPLGAYLVGYFGPAIFEPQPFGFWPAVIAVAVVPILFVAVLVEVAVQARMLARTTRVMARLSARASEPNTLSEQRAGQVGGAVRRELDRLSGALDSTLDRVAAIEAMVENQVSAIERAGSRAQTRAQSIRDLLQQERDQLSSVAEAMNEGAAAVVHAVGAEVERVRAANETAAREIREAEGLLSRQLQSFKALAEDSSRAAHEKVEAIETVAGKLEAVSSASVTAAGTLATHLTEQQATLTAAASRLEAERARIEQALEAQRALLAQVEGVAAAVSERLDTAMTAANARVTESLAEIEARSTSASHSLRSEAEAAAAAGSTAAQAIEKAAAAARDAAADMRAAVGAEMAALETSLGHGMRSLDDVAGTVSRTLTGASANAKLLVESLDQTVRTVEAASNRLVGLLDQVGDRASFTESALENASQAVENRLAQVPEMAAEHASRLSALLEDQAQRMGALALSLTRRTHPNDDPTESSQKEAAPPSLSVAAQRHRARAEERRGPKEPPTAAPETGPEETAPPVPTKGAAAAASFPPMDIRPTENGAGITAFGRIGRTLKRAAAPLRVSAAVEPAPPPIQNGGFWSTLFARIEGEETADPVVPHGANVSGHSADGGLSSETRTQYTLETLYALAIDLDRLLEEDPPMDLWRRYRAGEADAFARRLIALKSAGLEHRIRHKYRDDAEFREHANRYRERFKDMLNGAGDDQNDPLWRTPAARLFVLLGESLGPLDEGTDAPRQG